MGTISQNQYDYLNNLVKAGGGNGEWAKAQLQGATVETPEPAAPPPSAPSPSSTNSGSNSFGGSSYGVNYTPPSQSAPAPNYSTPSTPSYSTPSSGSQYSNVPGTNWQSTNPSNPNSAKYYADGSPVPSISYSNQQTGQKFDGYGTPEQFQSLMNAPTAADKDKVLSAFLNSGSLISNDSIYNKSTTPVTSTAYANTASPTKETFTPTGYTKNPAVDAMSSADQLTYYKAHPQEAQMEIQRAKQVWDQATSKGDTNGAYLAHQWADQLRQATGISDSDPIAGNNNGKGYQQQAEPLNGGTASTPGGTIGTAGNGTAGGTTVGSTGSDGNSDYMNKMTQLINSIYDNSYASQSQKLKENRDAALANLLTQENVAHQSAYDQRNSADVANVQNQQRLKELMAENGLSSSGDNIQAALSQGAARQSSIGNINRDESNAVQNIANQRSVIQNNANANDLALMQQLQAAKATNSMDALNTDQSRNLQIAQLMGYLGGQRTMAGQAQDANLTGMLNGRMTLPAQLQIAGLTGQFGDQSTLAGKQANWNAYKDAVGLTQNLGNGPQSDWGSLVGGGQTYTAQQQHMANLWNVAQQTGTIPNELADMYNLPHGTKTTDSILKNAQAEYYLDHGNYFDARAFGGGSGTSSVSEQKYQDDKARGETESEVAAHAQDFQSAQDVKDYFNANSAYLTKKLGGAKAVNDLKNMYLSPFNQDNKLDTSQYDKALSAAQRDPRWVMPDADRQAIIKEYQGYYSNPNQQ